MNQPPVIIVDYDPTWPQQYEAEKALIEQAIRPHITRIAHAGSTSVPSLSAKPIIDILIGLRSLDDARSCIEPLERLGYQYVPEHEGNVPDRRYFRKPHGTDGGTHHVHMVVEGTDGWIKPLLFRDFLRAHPESARAYDSLKRRLADQYQTDRVGYTKAKTEFILETEALAQAWHEQQKV